MTDETHFSVSFQFAVFSCCFIFILLVSFLMPPLALYFSLSLSLSPSSLTSLSLLSLLSNSPLSSFFSLLNTIKPLFSCKINLPHFAACYACMPHAAISSCLIEDCVASPPAANQFVCISSPSPIAFVSSPVETSICICCGRKSTTDATQFMRFHLPRHFLIFFHLQLASLHFSFLLPVSPHSRLLPPLCKINKKAKSPRNRKKKFSSINFLRGLSNIFLPAEHGGGWGDVWGKVNCASSFAVRQFEYGNAAPAHLSPPLARCVPEIMKSSLNCLPCECRRIFRVASNVVCATC